MGDATRVDGLHTWRTYSSSKRPTTWAELDDGTEVQKGLAEHEKMMLDGLVKMKQSAEEGGFSLKS